MEFTAHVNLTDKRNWQSRQKKGEKLSYYRIPLRTVVDASGVSIAVRGVQDGALAQLDGLLYRQIEPPVAVFFARKWSVCVNNDYINKRGHHTSHAQ